MKRILICTSNGGNGLVSASEAIKYAIEARHRDYAVSIVDIPTEAKLFSRYLVNDLYNYLLRKDVGITALYVRMSSLIMYDKWSDYFDDTDSIKRTILARKPDIIIVTSPWILSSVARAMDGERVPVYSVVVDLGAKLPLGWICNEVTACIASTDDARKYLVDNGMKIDLVSVGGIVVHPKYIENCSAGYETGNVLVLAGREGSGNTYETVKALLPDKGIKRINVLCGNNATLRSRIEDIGDDRVRAYGYVDDLQSFYTACQVVVSKCGAMTFAECIAVCRPLVVDATHGIMQQEMGNTDILERLGTGVLAYTKESLLSETSRLLADKGHYDALTKKCRDAKVMLDPYGIAEMMVNGG